MFPSTEEGSYCTVYLLVNHVSLTTGHGLVGSYSSWGRVVRCMAKTGAGAGSGVGSGGKDGAGAVDEVRKEQGQGQVYRKMQGQG